MLQQSKLKLFNVAIDAIFKNWTALQLAVYNVSKENLLFYIIILLCLRMQVGLIVRKRQSGWWGSQKTGSMRTKNWNIMKLQIFLKKLSRMNFIVLLRMVL